MKELKQVPFLRIAISLILGIAAYTVFPFLFGFIKFAVALLFLFLLFLQFKKIDENFESRWVFGFASMLVIFFIGYWLSGYNLSEKELSYSSAESCIYVATVSDPIIERDKTVKTFLDFDFCKEYNKARKINGKALAFFQTDSTSLFLEPGDQIILKGIVTPVKTPGNPYEFDYKKYLSYHKVSQQVIIKSGQWKLLSKNNGNIFIIYANRIQKYLLSVFRNTGLQGDEYAVASALIIGYKDKIDSDIKKAYSSSGAMHILSVSGLHVGIVFIVFNFLLSFFDKLKRGKIYKAVILIFLLWSYASITGLSVAVIRAGAMFSFVVIGKALYRNVNIINTISASAVLLLVINPMYLFEIGFQLSYLAVLGIVLFQEKIYKRIYIKNWLLDKIWALMAVSIAAQISTFPVTLYHFHQFPNYFLLTNILVIPLSTLVLYLGLALFSFSFWEGFAGILGKVLTLTVKVLNEIILFIERLPYSISENIFITPAEVFLLYVLISFIALFFILKQMRHLIVALFSLIILTLLNIYVSYNTINQRVMIAYNIPNSVSLDFITGNKNILLTNIQSSDNKFQTIRNNWIHSGVNKNKIVFLNNLPKTLKEPGFFLKGNYILFGNKKIGIIDVKYLKKQHLRKLKLDYLFVLDNKYFSLKNISNNFLANHIVFTNLNYSIFNKILLENKTFRFQLNCIAIQGSFKGLI